MFYSLKQFKGWENELIVGTPVSAQGFGSVQLSGHHEQQAQVASLIHQLYHKARYSANVHQWSSPGTGWLILTLMHEGCSAMRRTSPIKSGTTPSTCTEQSVWGSSRECRSSDGWPLPCVVDLCRSHSCWKWSGAIVETLRLSSCSHPKVLFSWNPRGEPSSSSERRKKKRKEV